MKTMCAVLACTTIMSSMLAAYATEEAGTEELYKKEKNIDKPCFFR